MGGKSIFSEDLMNNTDLDAKAFCSLIGYGFQNW